MKHAALALALLALPLLAACTDARTRESPSPSALSAPGRDPVYASPGEGGFVLFEAIGNSAPPTRLGSLPRSTRALALSPDGRTLALLLSGPPDRIVSRELRGSADRTLFTAEPGERLQGDLAWRPDGSGLAIVAAPPENVPGAPSTRFRLRSVPADGSMARELFASDSSAISINRWRADGKVLFFGVARYRTDDPGSLWSVNADGSNPQDLRLPGAPVEVVPDGSRMVYSPVGLVPGVVPELWVTVPGRRSERVAQVPGLAGFRLLPDGLSILALTLSSDRHSLGLYRVAVDGGAVTPVAGPIDRRDLMWASLVPMRAVAPNGGSVLIVVSGRTGEEVLWYELPGGPATKLTGPGSLVAGWR